MDNIEDISGLLGDHLESKNLVKAENYDELLHLIEERVHYLIQHEPDLLMSYLYRLDVDEYKIRQLFLEGEIAVEKSIAQLILNRQIERVKTKSSYKQPPIEGWDW